MSRLFLKASECFVLNRSLFLLLFCQSWMFILNYSFFETCKSSRHERSCLDLWLCSFTVGLCFLSFSCAFLQGGCYLYWGTLSLQHFCLSGKNKMLTSFMDFHLISVFGVWIADIDGYGISCSLSIYTHKTAFYTHRDLQHVQNCHLPKKSQFFPLKYPRFSKCIFFVCLSNFFNFWLIQTVQAWYSSTYSFQCQKFSLTKNKNQNVPTHDPVQAFWESVAPIK